MSTPSPAGRTLVRLGLVVAAAGALAVAAAGPGTRFEAWDFRTGLTVMRWGARVALAGGALSLLGALARGGWAVGATGIVVALAGAAGPILFQRAARSVPPIHDITTDTSDPPPFVAVLPRRANAPNPAEYGGPGVAAQQQAAYPDVKPLLLSMAPEAAFDRALEAARLLGWEIVTAEKAWGRIEATETTRWFGFKDDVVVRIRLEGTGSRVDVRSKSRVGRSDVGANARRVRRFLDMLRGEARE